MKQVSIITVNYNDKEGLQSTIDSVKRQKFRDFEHIIIDAASTDGSVDFIKAHQDRFSYWVSEKDEGIYDGMNKGIAQAKGKYVLFLNSGDYLISKDALSHNFDELEQDALEEDNLEYQELDIDYLAGNFLEDLLDVIQEIDALSKADKALGESGIQGTAIGYDAETQISTFVNDTEAKFIRQIEDSVQMQVNKNDSVSIVIEQEGKVNRILNNGGTSSRITIRQGS